MDDFMLFVKFLLFFGMEFTVLAVIAIVIFAGLYQIVRDKVRESRREDEIAAETTSGSSTAAHHS
jgi:uncharacterized membrane protein